MKRLGAMLLLSAIALSSAASAADQKPYVSWGKPGVSFAQYRAEAVDCGYAGATKSFTDQAAYKDARHGLNAQDSELERGDAAEYVMIYRRNLRRNIPKLQTYLVGNVEKCLLDRGYKPFVLTTDQKKNLDRLERGSQERFEFLHGLGSDGNVLSEQSVALEKR